MHKVSINKKIFFAENGSLLSDILMHNSLNLEHPCAGKGLCKKCTVKVNGKEVLSCQYRIFSDITVSFTENGNIHSESGAEYSDSGGEIKNLVLDIGTTTLALAALTENGKTASVITRTNPQRIFGADIISRINYCKNNGVAELQNVLINICNDMISSVTKNKTEKLFVTGNVTMLHIFTGTDCSSLGVSPYTPVFLNEKDFNASKLNINKVREIKLLPSIHTFTGADIVSGMNFAGFPPEKKYYLLIDLGTNAEIVLYSSEKGLCTAAAAGPCFEGANISCGMSAVNGAIYQYSQGDYKTIGDETAKGICGTGLIDIISYLLQKGYIDENGYMPSGKFNITDKVYLSNEDVRQYQLAKSAIFSAIMTLINHMGITFSDIDKMFISGGFSASVNTVNAVKTGLFPKELLHKCKAIKNSALLGAIKYSNEKNKLDKFVKITKYEDLSSDKTFSRLFIENMIFETEEL